MDIEQDKFRFSSKNPNSLQLSPTVDGGDQDKTDEELFNLGWLFSVFRRRALAMLGVGLTLAFLTGSAIVKKSQEIVLSFEGKFQLLIEPVSAEGRLTQQFVQAQNSGVDNINRVQIEDQSLFDYETQIRVLKSPQMLSNIIERIQETYPEINYESVRKALSIQRLTYERSSREYGTKIMSFSYKDPDPKKILFILEVLADEYLNYSLQQRLTSLNQGIKFLSDRLPDLQTRVDKIQEEMQLFRQQYDLLDPNVQALELAKQSTSLEQQQRELNLRLAELNERYNNLKNTLGEGDAVSVLGGTAQYQQLLIERNRLESQIAVESSRLQESSLPMQSLREKQRSIDNLLLREANKIIKTTESQIQELLVVQNTLTQNQAELERNIEQFPYVMRKYTDLQRELDLATQTLKDFLSKLDALRLNAKQQEVPWELIAPPELTRDEAGRLIPATPIQTRRQVAIATILSLLLGVGTGFLIEVLITVFHTPDEIKAAAKLPLLGVIPLAKELKHAVAKSSNSLLTVGGNSSLSRLSSESPYTGSGTQTALVGEAFRSLYTNIALLSADRPIRSLVIGASGGGDGKSTVAVNLAKTAAAIGQRVLLVDADFRDPQIHERLGLPNLRGFSDAISTDISLNEVIQRSPTDENLFVLTAGHLPSDPIKVLSSKKRQYLMEQFQAFFDFVIYDTPPVVGLADGSLIAANTDGIVMVVRIEKTDRSLIAKALEGFKIAGVHALGVVANGVKN